MLWLETGARSGITRGAGHGDTLSTFLTGNSKIDGDTEALKCVHVYYLSDLCHSLTVIVYLFCFVYLFLFCTRSHACALYHIAVLSAC